MRVLVVEDDSGIHQFLTQGLSEAGYAVDLAVDGLKGLDYALAADYDVLVVDIQLPRLSGLELFEKVEIASNPIPRPFAHCPRHGAGPGAGAGCRGRRLPGQTLRLQRTAGPTAGAAATTSPPD